MELRITTESFPYKSSSSSSLPQCSPSAHRIQTRHLLYKHGDDLRQDLLALQFIRQVDYILKSSGLDLCLRTFGCTPVASKRGFIEWIPGCVPLSKICDASLYRIQDEKWEDSMCSAPEKQREEHARNPTSDTDEAPPVPSNSSVSSCSTSQSATDIAPCKNISCPSCSERCKKKSSKEWLRYQFMPRPSYSPRSGRSTNAMNPVQEFLRSAAYDADAPYFIRKDVMDNYVKSCAGYCVATYLLVSFHLVLPCV